MNRRPTAIIGALLIVAIVAVPALAQQYVSVQNSRFEWTGKQDRTANFRWSATIDNPTKRPDIELRVTLTLVDGAGNVVGTDSTTVTVGKMGQAEVSQHGSLPYDDAARVAQYRVSVESAGS